MILEYRFGAAHLLRTSDVDSACGDRELVVAHKSLKAVATRTAPMTKILRAMAMIRLAIALKQSTVAMAHYQ